MCIFTFENGFTDTSDYSLHLLNYLIPLFEVAGPETKGTRLEPTWACTNTPQDTHTDTNTLPVTLQGANVESPINL